MGTAAGRLGEAVAAIRGAFVGAALFSAAINILTLTGPLFMLQVYDRVLASRSVPTLLAIAVLAAGMYVFMGFFEMIRSRVMSRAGYRLDAKLAPVLFRKWIAGGAGARVEAAKPLQELSVLRQFYGSPGFTSLFDLPWAPFYVAIVYLIHPWLGYLTIAGALVVALLAFANDRATHRALLRATIGDYSESRLADAGRQQGEALVAMGMVANVESRWRSIRDEAAWNAQRAGERGELFSSASKATRMLMQSALLGLGAYLVIVQEISSGSIIAGSIIGGKALAPIDQAIGHWKSIKRAREAYLRLAAVLEEEEKTAPVALPEPVGHLELRGVSVHAPGQGGAEGKAILNRVSFEIRPGDGLGVIGPSAAGKSTLARILVGAWKPDAGEIRLDGANLDQWDPETLGRHIGYLPQTGEMLAGTVRDN